MVDKVQELSATYTVDTHNDLQEFITNAVDARVEEMALEAAERGKRFAAEVEKHNEVLASFKADAPDPSQDIETLKEWDDQLVMLERSAITAETQSRVHEASTLNPNTDLIKRQARRDVAGQHPEEYEKYQLSNKVQRFNKLEAQVDKAHEKLTESIDKNDTSSISRNAKGLDVAVSSIQKHELYEPEANPELHNKLESVKALATKGLEIKNDKGLDR